MTPFYHPHRLVLLSSSFKYPDRRLFFSRARLFPDRIELTGWHLGRKHTQQILLDELDRIDWDIDASRAVFHLSEGGEIRLVLPQFDSWKQSLERRISWSAPGRLRITHPMNHTARGDLPLHELITFSSAMG